MILPVAVVAGLAIGIGFIIAFSMFFSFPPRLSFSDKPPVEDIFDNIEKIPEVTLFIEKYEDLNSTKGFSRSENGTIRFMYVASAGIDKDGNGYGETNRRFELIVLYDESGDKPIHDSFEPERVKHMETHCKEHTKVTPNIDEAFSDIMPVAYNEDVGDSIQNSECFS